jgi:hypothetical protein
VIGERRPGTAILFDVAQERFDLLATDIRHGRRVAAGFQEGGEPTDARRVADDGSRGEVVGVQVGRPGINLALERSHVFDGFHGPGGSIRKRSRNVV